MGKKIAGEGESQVILQSLPLSFALWCADNRLPGCFLWGFGGLTKSSRGISGGQL